RRSWWLEAITPAATLAEAFAKSHGKLVNEVMSHQVISAEEDTPLAEIARLMVNTRIKRVPILLDGKLTGMVSQSTLIKDLASDLARTDNVKETARAIRFELLPRLSAQSWTDFGSRNVTVTDGTVHLWGLISSEEERRGLIALAEDVPGV